jgi:hypothetical protein
MICFRDLWQDNPINLETRAAGVLPILSRLIAQSTGGPLSVRNAVEVQGQYHLGHTVDASGTVDRVLLSMHADLYGPAARTHDPQPANAGQLLHVGRVFAEHVFTRPFADPAQRKVAALAVGGQSIVPADRVAFRPAPQTLVLPTGAHWIEPDFARDAAQLAFGLSHTDSNQHVNSLVYPQLFEDAALRRLFDLGKSTRALLVDHIDIAFRKPCFAGQRMHLWVRCFEHEGTLGCVGYLGDDATTAERAHCYCSLSFREGELSP